MLGVVKRGRATRWRAAGVGVDWRGGCATTPQTLVFLLCSAQEVQRELEDDDSSADGLARLRTLLARAIRSHPAPRATLSFLRLVVSFIQSEDKSSFDALANKRER